MITDLTKGYDTALLEEIATEVDNLSTDRLKIVRISEVVPGIKDVEDFYSLILQPQGVENISYLRLGKEDTRTSTKRSENFFKDTGLKVLPEILDSIQGDFSVKYNNGEILTFNFSDDAVTLTGRRLSKSVKDEIDSYFTEIYSYIVIVDSGVLKGLHRRSEVSRKQAYFEKEREDEKIVTQFKNTSLGILYKNALVPQIDRGFPSGAAGPDTLKNIVITELPAEFEKEYTSLTQKYKRCDLGDDNKSYSNKLKNLMNSSTKVEVRYSNGEVIELTNNIICDHFYSEGTTKFGADRLEELTTPFDLPKPESNLHFREEVKTPYSNLYDLYTQRIAQQNKEGKIDKMVVEGELPGGFNKYRKENLLELQANELERVLKNVNAIQIYYKDGEIALLRSPGITITQYMEGGQPNSTERLTELYLLATKTPKN